MNPTINLLLEEALNEPDIGTTARFRWHATAVGIAALWIEATTPTTPTFRVRHHLYHSLAAQSIRSSIDPSTFQDGGNSSGSEEEP